MKKTILIFALALGLCSCEQEEPYPYWHSQNPDPDNCYWLHIEKGGHISVNSLGEMSQVYGPEPNSGYHYMYLGYHDANSYHQNWTAEGTFDSSTLPVPDVAIYTDNRYMFDDTYELEGGYTFIQPADSIYYLNDCQCYFCN